eukprot:TRINITY_DN4778_c0_g1_i4.p1 TRINITY_DN4778_c0_g1~~TRINITY_DN4778_c0_g1_i4.p1  ORF type:complete len:740 (+),score=127.31 TRINITY_DN4778_c0_g1_i4:164-2383(+)
MATSPIAAGLPAEETPPITPRSEQSRQDIKTALTKTPRSPDTRRRGSSLPNSVEGLPEFELRGSYDDDLDEIPEDDEYIQATMLAAKEDDPEFGEWLDQTTMLSPESRASSTRSRGSSFSRDPLLSPRAFEDLPSPVIHDHGCGLEVGFELRLAELRQVTNEKRTPRSPMRSPHKKSTLSAIREDDRPRRGSAPAAPKTAPAKIEVAIDSNPSTQEEDQAGQKLERKPRFDDALKEQRPRRWTQPEAVYRGNWFKAKGSLSPERVDLEGGNGPALFAQEQGSCRRRTSIDLEALDHGKPPTPRKVRHPYQPKESRQDRADRKKREKEARRWSLANMWPIGADSGPAPRRNHSTPEVWSGDAETPKRSRKGSRVEPVDESEPVIGQEFKILFVVIAIVAVLLLTFFAGMSIGRHADHHHPHHPVPPIRLQQPAPVSRPHPERPAPVPVQKRQKTLRPTTVRVTVEQPASGCLDCAPVHKWIDCLQTAWGRDQLWLERALVNINEKRLSRRVLQMKLIPACKHDGRRYDPDLLLEHLSEHLHSLPVRTANEQLLKRMERHKKRAIRRASKSASSRMKPQYEIAAKASLEKHQGAATTTEVQRAAVPPPARTKRVKHELAQPRASHPPAPQANNMDIEGLLVGASAFQGCKTPAGWWIQALHEAWGEDQDWLERALRSVNEKQLSPRVIRKKLAAKCKYKGQLVKNVPGMTVAQQLQYFLLPHLHTAAAKEANREYLAAKGH